MRPKKLKPPLERDVQAAIVDYFAAVYRITFHRRNTGALKKGKHYVRFNTKGMADLWAVHPRTGRHIECEVKRFGEEPDEKQSEWLLSCQGWYAIAFWADSLEMAIEKYEDQRNEEER